MQESEIAATNVDDSRDRPIERILLTGATGFVGRYVLRELVTRGYIAICVVRTPGRLATVSKDLDQSRISAVTGSIFDRGALREAAERADAAIHLVGIIMESRLSGQTFDRIHRRGTMAIVDAVRNAGITRYIHMSALGARADALCGYHLTKYEAEKHVRTSGLDWTVFQPSIIHGHDGEFMRLMKTFACGLIPPVMPYFGSGEARLQPVSVKDVAFCFVDALRRAESIGQIYPLGGPAVYNWKELYQTCRRIIPGSRSWKPLVSQPVVVAKLLARTVMKTPLVPAHLRFNVGQVQMSQEDSVCPTEPVESMFGITLRNFERELTRYAALIE